MESVVAEKLDSVASREAAEWDEALRRVEAYLAAWGVNNPDSPRDWAREIVDAARRDRVPRGDEIQAAMKQADEFLPSWLEKPVSIEALAFGAPVDRGLDFGDRSQIEEILSDGALNLGRARFPARPPETRPMTMQTSLSRLPSIRLIGGWIVLAALLFIAFVLTHR